MFKLVRLGNTTVSENYAALTINKTSMSLNVIATLMFNVTPGEARVDVGIDNKGDGTEAYITAFTPKDDHKTEGRQLTKARSFSASSIQAALEPFRTNKFRIEESFEEFEGNRWHKLVPVYEAEPVKNAETVKTVNNKTKSVVAVEEVE